MHLGQEIYTFFNKYGIEGLVGLNFSMIIIGLVIYKTLKVGLNENIDTYQGFLEKIMPYSIKKNSIVIDTINNVINLFLLISFNIMVAGFSTYFFQEMSLPKIVGGILISAISFITFFKSIDGVIKINTYLIPSLIVLIIFLGIKKIETIEIVKESSKSLYWIISSILYASYNSITLIPILISLRKELNNKKEARGSSYIYIYNNDYIIDKHIFINEYIFK